jgi:proteasome lid subunit RPN8/RPN11
MLGNQHENRQEVLRVVPTNNAASASGTFAIPDYELRRTALIAQECKLMWLGIYHSHPSGSAKLSDADQAALYYSALPWLIITVDPASHALCLTGFAAGTGCQILVSQT